MFGVTTSDDYKPVTWMGRYPVDVTTLLVGFHVALAVLTALLFFGNAAGILNYLEFDSAFVLRGGQIWRLATYALIHLPGNLLWFAIEMYLLFVFGRDVERFVGRRAFITLYALLLLVPTMVLTLLGLWIRLSVAGSASLHFGIFIAFVAIYPDVEMMLLRIPMKWLAIILIAIGTLGYMAYHDWASMIVLWSSVLAAFVFMRSRGVGEEMEWWDNLKTRFGPKPKFHVVRSTPPRRASESEDLDSIIDPLLEKISKHGINSLTASERRTLDRARNQLLKKSP